MQFDLRDHLKRLWEMRKWARVLILIMGISGFLFFVSFYTDYISAMWTGIAFFVLLGIVIIAGFEVTRRTKQQLSKLVYDGEYIKARLTTESWEAVDRDNTLISEWDMRVRNCLTKEEYDLWRSNTGIIKPESETIIEAGDIGLIRYYLRVDRNYMHIRILGLKEIINKL